MPDQPMMDFAEAEQLRGRAVTGRTRWSRLRYVNGMHHVVSDDLLPAIQEAMTRATPPGELEDVRIVDSVRLELGGPWHMGRPLEEFVFHDLVILIPSEDFQLLLDSWQTAPRMISLGQAFYRLTSWEWQCLVVGPAQREELLVLLDAGADQAERRAAAFCALTG